MGGRAINTSPPTRFFWEIQVTDRLFGTSMMFGIATRNCNVHADSFVNLIGSDSNGWGLSHKGILWHDSLWSKYTKPFKENTATRIGMLYDGHRGTLTYFKDGVNLGIAFKDLNKISEKLYPMVCSTAAKTQMTLTKTCRDFYNLQDMCRHAILKKLPKPSDVHKLDLPRFLKEFVENNETDDEDDNSDQGCEDQECKCTQSTMFPILNPNFNSSLPAPAQHFKESSFHFSQLWPSTY